MRTTMKTTMKTMQMLKAVSAGALLTLAGALPLSGQGVLAPGEECASGMREGSLGISGLDCVGECTVNLRDDGGEDRWEFSTEPRIFSIDEGSPADGILQPGDRLVAIDGALITTREGGRRYANLDPGEIVTVRYRREGVVHEAGIRVGSRCRAQVSGIGSRGRVPPPPPRPDQPDVREPRGVATAPRVRRVPTVAPVDAAVAPSARPVGAARAWTVPASPGLLDSTPRGRIGIGLGCTQCGTQTNEETGEEVWFFTGPIEVTQVNAGGPAEKAGIQLGDLIRAIDGHDITTEEGGLAFSTLVPGKAVPVTVVRRNGREETVTLIPGQPGDSFSRARGVAPPAQPSLAVPVSPVAGVASPAIPPLPDRGAVAEPGAGYSGPGDLPVSYSGGVAGVEVLIRGGPIGVSEMGGARTLIIHADGLWIRIRVPAGGGGTVDPEGGVR